MPAAAAERKLPELRARANKRRPGRRASVWQLSATQAAQANGDRCTSFPAWTAAQGAATGRASGSPRRDRPSPRGTNDAATNEPQKPNSGGTGRGDQEKTYSSVRTGNVQVAGHCGKQFRVRNGVVVRSFTHACPRCGTEVQSAKASGRIQSQHKKPNGKACPTTEWVGKWRIKTEKSFGELHWGWTWSQ